MPRNVMVTPSEPRDGDSLKKLLDEGAEALNELTEELRDIKVPVTKTDTQVLEAIKNIFGLTYLNDNGSSYITYDMYLECAQIVRNAGRAVAAEFAQ